jgi:hypothetical protein
MTYYQWSNENLLDEYERLIEKKIESEQYLEEYLDRQTMQVVQTLSSVAADLSNVTEILKSRGYSL